MNIPIKVSEPKELPLLFFTSVTDIHISLRQRRKVSMKLLFDQFTVCIRADTLSTQFQVIFLRVSPCYHDTTVHFGRVQSPVRYANEGHSLLALDSLRESMHKCDCTYVDHTKCDIALEGLNKQYLLLMIFTRPICPVF